MGFVGTRTIVATIAAAASLSDAIELRGSSVIRLTIPAAWTAADITFQVDDGDGTFRDLWMEWGFELMCWVEVGTSIEMSLFFRGLHIDRLRLRSGTGGAPVAQVAEREIGVVVGVK